MTKKKPDFSNEEMSDDTSKQTELLTHPPYEELLQKLDEAEKKTNEYWERILRMQAEADNLSRRQERDVENAHKFALEKFVKELIPIIDSLESCIAKVPDKLDETSLAVIDGVKLTLKMFYAAIAKFGVKQVDPLNELFNPEFQQAISLQFDPAVAQGTVLSVLQKGYTLNQRLIRPALVIVSKDKE